MAGEYRNRTGGVYALTTFASILPGHADEVQAYLDAMPLGPDSPLARLEQLHLSRIHIFHELVDQDGGHKVDKLDAPQLVFTSSFDGDLDVYLDAIADKVSYSTWVDLSTVANGITIAGERGGVMRDMKDARSVIASYRELQDSAKKACFIRSE